MARSGDLFQDCFKAHLVEADGHYFELWRYIHLNPVRGSASDRPVRYRWSCYGGYFRESRTLSWVTYERVPREFGRSRKNGLIAYRKFVSAGMKESCGYHGPMLFTGFS